MTQTERALLLGSTQGIGFELARQLLAKGMHLTLSGRDAGRLQAAVTNLRAMAPEAQVDGIVLDLRDLAQTQQALADSGPIDHLVLCGSSDVAWGPLQSLSMTALEQALRMKLVGYLNAVQAALPYLTERSSITFVGGAAARAAMPGTVGLAAVNGALEAATRTLARELAPRRVNLVSPGLTDTAAYAGMAAEARQAMFAGAAARLPAGRIGHVADIAQAIALAMGNPFMTGSVLDVDGGAHLG